MPCRADKRGVCGRVFGGHEVGPGGRDGLGREGASETAPEAVRQAVGGGCRSGWGRLLSVTNAVEAGTWRRGDSGWAQAGRPGGGVPPSQRIPWGGGGEKKKHRAHQFGEPVQPLTHLPVY